MEQHTLLPVDIFEMPFCFRTHSDNLFCLVCSHIPTYHLTSLGIHEAYLQAGSDIIETNTFSGTSIGMADYKMEHLVKELNVASAKLAREACAKYEALDGRPRFAAGAIGPTNRTASISPDVNDPGARNVTFDQLVEAYTESTDGLVEGGADIILIETIFDTLNAKAAIYAVETYFDEKASACR